MHIEEYQMNKPAAQFSPQTYARIGGVLYLIIIAAGLFAEVFVRDRLIVPADAEQPQPPTSGRMI
jgi:hypothetical protein